MLLLFSLLLESRKGMLVDHNRVEGLRIALANEWGIEDERKLVRREESE